MIFYYIYDMILYYIYYHITCLGGEEVFIIFLCLHHCQAIGNMGAVMEKAKPSVKSSLKTCIRNEAASLSVQKAAIQAFRKMTITEEVNWCKNQDKLFSVHLDCSQELLNMQSYSHFFNSAISLLAGSSFSEPF